MPREQTDDYAYVTDEMFDDKLAELIGEKTPEQLLAIPGVYEILREHFNNDVLEELDKEHGKNDYATDEDD